MAPLIPVCLIDSGTKAAGHSKALNVDDLDGASTLSAKAHVLLLKLSNKYSGQKARVLLIN